ncbi:MAG TPA: hypothetical protein VE871_01645 [Longimicrobium sp.]|nr:hypothetical protein [Longimicrobium sp.]
MAVGAAAADGEGDDPRNVVSVPVGIAAAKAGMDQNVIAPLVEEGLVSQYSATPAYQGGSFIPTAIRVVASDPGQFSRTIHIQGDALARSAES